MTTNPSASKVQTSSCNTRTSSTRNHHQLLSCHSQPAPSPPSTATSTRRKSTSRTTFYRLNSQDPNNALHPPHLNSIPFLPPRHSSSNLQLLYLCICFYSNAFNSTSTRNPSCARSPPIPSCKCAETQSRNGTVERIDD